jgi:hypothetical protein
MVWPPVVGRPAPTALMPWKAPEAVEQYSWPLTSSMQRRLVTVALNCVDVVAPSAAT